MSEKIEGLPRPDIQTVKGGEQSDSGIEIPFIPVISKDDGIDAYYDRLREAKRGNPLFEVSQTGPRKTKATRPPRRVR